MRLCKRRLTESQVKLRLYARALISTDIQATCSDISWLTMRRIWCFVIKTDSQLSLHVTMLAVHVSENHRYVQGCNFLPNITYHVHAIWLFNTFHIRRWRGWSANKTVNWPSHTTASFFCVDRIRIIFWGSRIVSIRDRGDQNRYFVPEPIQSINRQQRKFNRNKLNVATWRNVKFELICGSAETSELTFILVTGLEIQHPKMCTLDNNSKQMR